MKQTRKGVSQIRRAKLIARSLGYRVAARFLAKRGWTFDAAHYILLGCTPRR